MIGPFSNSFCQSKLIVNSLFSIGDPVSDQEQLDVILKGLPDEYDPLINFVNTRYEPFDLDELESLLLAQEVCPEEYKQHASSALATVNVACVPLIEPVQVIEEKNE